MKTKSVSFLSVALAAATLALAPTVANAEPRGCATNFGGRSFSGGYSNGNIHFSWSGGGSNRGYSYAGTGGRYFDEPARPSYTDHCKLIDTRYFTRGCDRYAKKTYLHERIDCHGRVVKCWKTYETVPIGGGYRH